MAPLETVSAKVADPMPRVPLTIENHVLTPAEQIRPHAVPAEMQVAFGHMLRTVGADWELAFELSDVLARHFHSFVLPRFLPSSMMRAWLEVGVKKNK